MSAATMPNMILCMLTSGKCTGLYGSCTHVNCARLPHFTLHSCKTVFLLHTGGIKGEQVDDPLDREGIQPAAGHACREGQVLDMCQAT